MSLSYTNYQALYPTSTVNQATVEKWLAIYKMQLKDYFRFDNTIKSKFIDIDFCGQGKVFLPMPLIENNQITVEEINKRTRMIWDIFNEADFLYKTDYFNDTTYIYALDFECLNCVCKCDQLKITGLWGLELPAYIENEIYALIEGKSQVVTTDPCQEIASEKIGEYSVTYRDTTTKSSSLDINNVYSIPLLIQLLKEIQIHFLPA